MKILLLGSTGQVGLELKARLLQSKHVIISFTKKECDLAIPNLIPHALAPYAVDLIINAAAYTAVDKAEEESKEALQINAYAVKDLALYCEAQQIPLIHFSTDYVFDGNKTNGYTEEDNPNPINAYGYSKLEGERFIQAHLEQHLILRTSWVFSKHRQNFVKTILQKATSQEEIRIVSDQWGCPTAAKDLARIVDKIIEKISLRSFKAWGVYHYSGQEKTNWYDFAVYFLQLAKEKGHRFLLEQLTPIATEAYPTKARRPKHSILATTKIENEFNLACKPWSLYLPEVIESIAEGKKL